MARCESPTLQTELECRIVTRLKEEAKRKGVKTNEHRPIAKHTMVR